MLKFYEEEKLKVTGETKRNSMKKNSLLLTLEIITLFTATIFLYQPVLHHKFIYYDDGVYVSGNPRVLTGLICKNITWAFTTMYFSNWHPLTWLTYMLIDEFSKADPAGYHFAHLILHSVNAVLLFLAVYRGTRFLWRSFAVAFLFAIHPLNVESVAWVSELKNILSTMFWLMAVLAYVCYAFTPNWRLYLVLAGFFILRYMSTPITLPLP